MDSGDNQDWCRHLYESRAAGLLLYARSLGLSHGEAEDVLQATFQALLQLKCPPDQSERYVLRAVRNRALNHRRSLVRRIRREFESKSWFEPTNDPSDREDEAIRQLAELPREQREVIVLKIWHQHTFESLGDLLNISPNTAAARYRYGLQKLRAALPRQEDEEHERQRIETDRDSTGTLDSEGPFHAGYATGFPTPAGN